MKLGWKDIDSFVKKPNPKARAILVYGPDDGLMRERAALMGRSVVADLHDPFNVAVLSAQSLLDDPARLMDEASAMSMMGGARLLRIEDGSDKITPLLKDYLANPSAENLIIIEAGELGPKSPLRALFEKSDNAAAVPCYVEDERGIATLIRQTLTEKSYGIQADALSWLASNIAGDRARARSEIEKLMLYMGGASKMVTLDDARAACGEAGDQSIDDLLYAIGGGKADKALLAYTKLLGEDVAVVSILRSLQSHFRRLHFTRSQMATGLDVDQAMKMLQPAIFFKYEQPFKSQLQKWSEKRLLTMLQKLSQIEAQTKQTGTPAETLCAQAILSIAA